MLRFLRRFWTGETDGLTAAALMIGAASLASRVIGVFRDRVLASTFGAGDQLDAYYAAFRVPDLIYTLVVFGALTAGFIPVFTEYLETRGREEAFRLAAQILTLVGVTVAIASAVFAVAAPAVVPHITPGFTGDKLALTIRLSRIMAWSPIFLGLSAVAGGVLQSMRRFVAFAVAPVLYNIGIILGALALAPFMGIAGVAWGVVAGAALHFFAQMTVAVPLGLRDGARPTFKSEGVRRILALMVPRTAGLAVTQLNLVAVLALATSLESGAVSVFSLANNLVMFPVGIIGVSYAIAAFPVMSRAAAALREDAFRHAFIGAARKIFFLNVPLTALFLLLRAQIVRLAFGAGSFDWNDTIRTANVFGWLTVALLAQAMLPLLVRAFFAWQDSWTPFWASMGATVLTIAFGWSWIKPYGVAGLAMAVSAATILQLLALWLLLRRVRGGSAFRELLASAGKTIAATLALAAVAYPLRQWIGTAYPLRTFLQVALQAAVATFGGLFAFSLVSWLMRSHEFEELRRAIAGRLWRRAKVAEGAEQAL